MASQRPQTSQIGIQDLTIVDADSHVKPDVDELIPYMDEDDAAREMIRKANHVESEIFTQTRAAPRSQVYEREREEIGDTDGSLDPIDDGYEPAGKSLFLDEFHIDYCILTPSGGTGGGALATINHDPTAVSYANAYNSWLLDNFIEEDDRFYGTVLVPNQAPGRAAEEIDRMAAYDSIVGVQLPAAGLVPPAGHRLYEPIYEAAQDRGLPIAMHTHEVDAASTFPAQRRWAETYSESHALIFPVASMWQTVSLICQGIPERFPDLDWVFQEPGFEWVPWLTWRLDDHYYQHPDDFPMLEKPPSEYIADQFHYATQPIGHTDNNRHLGWTMEMAGGGDTVVFSSDHPHADFDPPSEVLAPAKTQLDDESVRKLMGGTARDVFGL